ncbi:PDZ domain-containing protein [Roseomonas terrae]|uniref:PDZ domain-containing protein n=2 Tax=Neoroseomonas terrae TaxID=424799 RepID=A0ABS5EEW7_9PROT|nr:PDZ domain-containing protein [Neoroseomonas terrae]
MLVMLPCLGAAQEVSRTGAYPREEMRLVLGAGFAAILERHLESATPADLLVWSLAGMTSIDSALSVQRTGRNVRLLQGERLLLSRSLPERAEGESFATAGGAAADRLTLFQQAGWNASAAIRAAGASALIRHSFEAIFSHFDPFSRYITPEEAQAARERRTGEAGLGLRLAPGRGAGTVVVAVAAGSPAAEAGLHVGDRVLSIDGTRLRPRDAAGAAGLLEGPAGTNVLLLIERNRRRQELTLRRVLPHGSPVTAERVDDVLMIRIPAFSAQTERQVAAALLAAFSQGAPKAVVLDLRGNRGGLLSQAAAVADIFLGPGEAFRTAGRHAEASRIYVTAGGDLAQGVPLVVVVDGRTASSAEIVAAALSDRGRAAVIGTSTTGKGLVQLVVPLPDGGELLMSWSRLIMPAGWPLQDIGVLPGLCTTGGPAAAARALTALRAGSRPMGAAQAQQGAMRHPVPAVAAEALRAACPPAEVPNEDLPVARGLALDTAAAGAAMAQ